MGSTKWHLPTDACLPVHCPARESTGRNGRHLLGFGVEGLGFSGGLAFKAHRLCVSLHSRLESNKEEEEVVH